MPAERRKRVLVHGGAAAQERSGSGRQPRGAHRAGDAAGRRAVGNAHQRIARRGCGGRRLGRCLGPGLGLGAGWAIGRRYGRAHRRAGHGRARERCGRAGTPGGQREGRRRPEAPRNRRPAQIAAQVRTGARIGREIAGPAGAEAGRIAVTRQLARFRIVEIWQRARRARIGPARRHGRRLARFLAILDRRTQGERACRGLRQRIDGGERGDQRTGRYDEN